MFIGSISKNLVYPDAALQSRVKLVHSTSTRRTMTTPQLSNDDWLLVKPQDKTPAPAPTPPPPPPPTPLFKHSYTWKHIERHPEGINLSSLPSIKTPPDDWEFVDPPKPELVYAQNGFVDDPRLQGREQKDAWVFV